MMRHLGENNLTAQFTNPYSIYISQLHEKLEYYNTNDNALETLYPI